MKSKRTAAILTTLIMCCNHFAITAQNQTGNIRQSIKRIAKEMSRYNVIDSQSIGEGGFQSEQWDRFEGLCKKATSKELRELTGYHNAVVRCYAFHALALRKDTDIFSILISHLKDTAQAKTMDSDLGGSYSVADYFVNVVTPQYIDLKAYKLNEKQKEKLDSILLYDKTIRSGAKNEMLRELKPKSDYYERVKEIAEIENNGEGLIALSKYKNPQDTTLIVRFLRNPKDLYYALYAVREFPSPAFYPRLVQIFEDQWSQKAYDYPSWRLLYQALAQYPTPQTLSFFQRTLQTKDDFRRQTLGAYLLVALKKYPNVYFNEIKGQIKLDTYHMDEVAEDMQSNN